MFQEICKYCEFDGRRCTLLLIFRHVVFNKVYLILKRLQIKIKIKFPFSLVIGPLPPPPLSGSTTNKKNFFAAALR